LNVDMHDVVDERNIPISTGIPPVIYIAAIVGLIMIGAMVLMVFATSSANHRWPNAATLTEPLK
jgi:hypothetical protein